MIAEDRFLVITLRARGKFFNQQSKLFWLSSDSISAAKVNRKYWLYKKATLRYFAHKNFTFSLITPKNAKHIFTKY